MRTADEPYHCMAMSGMSTPRLMTSVHFLPLANNREMAKNSRKANWKGNHPESVVDARGTTPIIVCVCGRRRPGRCVSRERLRRRGERLRARLPSALHFFGQADELDACSREPHLKHLFGVSAWQIRVQIWFVTVSTFDMPFSWMRSASCSIFSMSSSCWRSSRVNPASSTIAARLETSAVAICLAISVAADAASFSTEAGS